MGLGSFNAAIPPVPSSEQRHNDDRGGHRPEPVRQQSKAW